MVTVPTLLTERLRLRAWRPEDLPALAAYYASDRSRFTGGPLDANKAWRKLAYFLGHWRLLGYGGWAVEERTTERVVGTCGIYFPHGKPEPELGFFAYEAGEGRGQMAEAARAALAHARDDLGLPRVVSYISPHNARSRALAERLGAANEGHCAAYSGQTGGDHDAWAHDFASAVAPERGEPTVLPDAPTLHTERLLLRGWRADDLDRMVEFYADPSSHFVGGPKAPHETWRQVAGYVGGRDLRGYGILAVEDRATGEFVGYAGPYYPAGWPEPEIAYGLMPGRRGEGLATEMAARALRHAYEDLEAVVDFGSVHDRMARIAGKERGAPWGGAPQAPRDAVRRSEPRDRRWPAANRPTASRRLQGIHTVRRTAPGGRIAASHHGHSQSSQQPLGWTTAISSIDAGNAGSQRVSERPGAHREDRFEMAGFDALIYRHRPPAEVLVA